MVCMAAATCVSVLCAMLRAAALPSRRTVLR